MSQVKLVLFFLPLCDHQFIITRLHLHWKLRTTTSYFLHPFLMLFPFSVSAARSPGETTVNPGEIPQYLFFFFLLCYTSFVFNYYFFVWEKLVSFKWMKQTAENHVPSTCLTKISQQWLKEPHQRTSICCLCFVLLWIFWLILFPPTLSLSVCFSHSL